MADHDRGSRLYCCHFFFFNDTATTEIYTLSLHDALPISRGPSAPPPLCLLSRHRPTGRCARSHARDRKSTRLNSSHVAISYAVFCLKKKKTHRDAYPLTNKTLHNRTKL